MEIEKSRPAAIWAIKKLALNDTKVYIWLSPQESQSVDKQTIKQAKVVADGT